MATISLLRIGVSRCLLGDNVRHDGGHKLDSVLIETLGRTVEWVPVCPEVEVGLGTPREAMQLVGDFQAPRLVTIMTRLDHTDAMIRFSAQRVRELETLNLAGFIFKSASPSCGIKGVPLVDDQGGTSHAGIGLFARAFMKHFPLMPVEEEGRLHDPEALRFFLERAADFFRSRRLA
jgi:uncharacterized protein YbbK (DUF523 family)